MYDLNGDVVQSTDADGRVTQYVYDPVNRQVEEDWLDGSGNAIHTIHTYCDADGETVGVTEWDASDSANATNYEYTYDFDGNLYTSRMAPGDLRRRLRLSVYTRSFPAAQRSTGTTVLLPSPTTVTPFRSPRARS